jgi:caffeoyl-CoA O-methyltransferase
MFLEIPSTMQARMHHLEQLDAEQRQRDLPASERFCQVPPEIGRFLAILAASAPDGGCVEVGTSAGYSTLWLWLARRGRGPRIKTCEVLPWKLEQAHETFRLCAISDDIEQLVGDARAHLAQCADVAFCFLDAEKKGYLDCYELIVPRLLTGGILCADNIDSHRDQLAPFVAHVLADPRVDSVEVPIGKGVLLARKKDPAQGRAR